MRKIINRTIYYSIKGGKKALQKSPRVKNALQRIAYTQMGIPLPNSQKYTKWLQRNFPDYVQIAKDRKELKNFTYKPLLSIIVPTYNTNIEFLKDCIDSVIGQVYENWELCVVDDASPEPIIHETILAYARQDERIKYKFLNKNQHIAGASNAAIELATGDFLVLFDHDDILWPNALFEVVKALNNNKKIDFIYTDEDKITENRFEHFNPFFKPDWNPDFLHSVNYITHLAVVRKELFHTVGGFRAKYNGAQDWDLFLRLTSATNKIYHIPKVLYSWRVHDLSTAKSTDSKPYVVEAQRKAITDDLRRKGRPDALVERDSKHSGYWNVRYPLQDNPLISIVIPSKNQYKVLKRCLDSIYQKSTYQNFEVIVVDTGSSDNKVRKLYKQLSARLPNFKLVDWPEQPFSYARSCNEGARVASGEILIMLNNDTEVITPNWMEQLAGDAQRTDIGAVGCLLFFPDKHHIQHAGIGVGLGGVAANSFSLMTLMHRMSQTQHLMINTKHDMTAVTAACMAVRKTVFDEVGGFDETYRVTYNDVDLCLRLKEKGYQNLYTPHVRLLHHESISVGLPEEIKRRDTKEFRDAQEKFVTQWKKYIEHDPNLNPNLSKDNALYDIPVASTEKS